MPIIWQLLIKSKNSTNLPPIFNYFQVVGAKSLEDFVAQLKRPRRVMLMVKAGQAVDDFIHKLLPLLSKGDIIIDGGNSEHQDTTRRFGH